MLENLPEPLGRGLRAQRAGMENVCLRRLLKQRGVQSIEVRSPAFEQLMPIPVRFTADGDGSSPPLSWSGVPQHSGTLLLIVEDADSPTPRPFVHAIAVNLAPIDGALVEGALTSGAAADELELGVNSFLRRGWLPPDPPPGHGEHHYVFQVFALDGHNSFTRLPGRQALFDAIADRATAAGALIGTYERPHRQLLEAPGEAPLDPPLEPPPGVEPA
ncbi:MAG TPA: YbhB/YbcL family Raf kinase inhibitor-like protein [Steroidobacteraceae bacterium]|jgi:hypothetical protein